MEINFWISPTNPFEPGSLIFCIKQTYASLEERSWISASDVVLLEDENSWKEESEAEGFKAGAFFLGLVMAFRSTDETLAEIKSISIGSDDDGIM